MNMKRMRGRNNRGGGGGGPIRHQSGNVPMNRNHVFDSSGPDMRVRGTAQQLFEKYLQHGRDATGAGDRVMAESYFQYAEHYFRILNAMNQAAQQNGQGGPNGGGQQPFPQGQHRRDHFADQNEEGRDGDDEPGQPEAADARSIPIGIGAPDA